MAGGGRITGYARAYSPVYNAYVIIRQCPTVMFPGIMVVSGDED